MFIFFVTKSIEYYLHQNQILTPKTIQYAHFRTAPWTYSAASATSPWDPFRSPSYWTTETLAATTPWCRSTASQTTTWLSTWLWGPWPSSTGSSSWLMDAIACGRWSKSNARSPFHIAKHSSDYVTLWLMAQTKNQMILQTTKKFSWRGDERKWQRGLERWLLFGDASEDWLTTLQNRP